jgi:hypothetical protein
MVMKGAKMQIIEKFIASKYGDDALCEDGLFINDKFIAVMDGVTAKGDILWNNKTSGFHAKETLLHAMEQLNGSESAVQTFEYLNAQLHKQYNGNDDFFLNNTTERIRSTIVIYSRRYKQIWCFGDCQFSINGQVFQEEMEIDLLLAEVRSVYLQSEIIRGKSVEELCISDPSHDIIFPVIKNQLYFSNCEKGGKYGFNVLDGFCNDFSKIIIHDVEEGDTVILASDGYPRLEPSLYESEMYLTELKENDPLCIENYKAGSGFTNGKTSLDDRTYIKFVV